MWQASTVCAPPSHLGCTNAVVSLLHPDHPEQIFLTRSCCPRRQRLAYTHFCAQHADTCCRTKRGRVARADAHVDGALVPARPAVTCTCDMRAHAADPPLVRPRCGRHLVRWYVCGVGHGQPRGADPPVRDTGARRAGQRASLRAEVRGRHGVRVCCARGDTRRGRAGDRERRAAEDGRLP